MMDFKAFKAKYEHKKVEEQPNQVTEQPVVSVCVQTYQHKSYIKKCLDGILMQETDFSIEILLGEDASSDGTREICLAYAQKHPDKIRLFLHHRVNNIKIGGNPTGRFNFLHNLYSARGKYVALCEGDDYWTDPKKLQKQVELLAGKKEVIACFTNAIIDNKQNEDKSEYVSDLSEGAVSKERIFWTGGSLYPTASLLFKRKVLASIKFDNMNEMAGDELLLFNFSLLGKVYYLDCRTCVYTRWKGGIFSSIVGSKEKVIEYKKKDIKIYLKFDGLTEYKVSQYLKIRICLSSLYIIRNSKSMKDKLIYSKYLSLTTIVKVLKKRYNG